MSKLREGIRDTLRGAFLDSIYAEFFKSLKTDRESKKLVNTVMKKELRLLLRELSEEEKKTVGFRSKNGKQ